MPGRPTQSCPQRAVTEALAREELQGEARRSAQRHLEGCETCRRHFRDLVGERFPRFRGYTVIERIGEGGFGVVYKVIHHAKQRTEALKVLFGKTAVRAAYFENEVHLIAKLQHPNIATLYEAHLSTPPLYYTMEYVEGEQLDAYFRRRQVSLPDRIRLLLKVVRAIGYAHQCGVVHRDIKPQNILVDERGEPRLLDFGIAKRLGLEYAGGEPPARSPEGFLGTFGYVPPEQSAGEEVDQRADIYSLGALLYYCVTGEPARLAGRPERLYERLQQMQVARAADLAAIIARCVDPLPEQRYPTCALLAEDLENYLAGRPIRAIEHPTLGYHLVRALALILRTRPFVVRGLIVIIVAAVLSIGAWRAQARWFTGEVRRGTTALVTVTTETYEAIRSGRLGADLPGLSYARRKSWRLLYGRLMERLAVAGPAVVVWDYYFPDCQPEFDPVLIRGFQALRAAGVPVVVGCRELDANGDPVICPDIRDAVDAVGTLKSLHPATFSGEWAVMICQQRGFGSPVPGLAVAALAALRHPDAEANLVIRPKVVTLRYRKREVRRGELRWYQDTTPLAYTQVQHVGPPLEEGGADYYPMRVPSLAAGEYVGERWNLEDVFFAEPEKLRSAFEGRVVVIGQTIPGVDEYPTGDGRTLFGCEVQAQAIAGLLSGAQAVRIERRDLLYMTLLWGTVAALLVGLLPSGPRLSPARAGALGVGTFVVGVVLMLLIARHVTDPGRIHAALALVTMLATAGPVYFVKTLRERQIALAPEPVWHPEPDTISSTLLATASDTPTPPRE